MRTEWVPGNPRPVRKAAAALSEIMQTYGKARLEAQELSGFYKDKLRETRLRKDAVRRYCPQDARLQGPFLITRKRSQAKNQL
jgi:hypothetical protein